MARRDLSRTVIEGGRYRFAKFLRRSENAAARADQRAWIDAVHVDPDLAEDRSLDRVIKRNRHPYDKLAVTRRWLRARCGRRWDDVFSELLARFDPRTIAGRHIVFDHMLRDVRRGSDPERPSGFRFEVDDDGILRVLPRGSAHHVRREKPRLPPWTDGFHAVRHDGRWWWIGDRIVNNCVQLTRCRLAHAFGPGPVARHFTRATLIRPMTSTDVGRLTSSPPRVRDLILWRGPVVAPADARLAR